MKQLLKTIVVLLIFYSASSHAENEVQSYQHEGRVSAFMRESHTVIINDQRYQIDNEVVHHYDAHKGQINLVPINFQLNTGQRVGFNLDKSIVGAGPRISELWVLDD